MKYYKYRFVVTIGTYLSHSWVDKAKGRRFPKLRGKLLPSLDVQGSNAGFALNWFGVRIKIIKFDKY